MIRHEIKAISNTIPVSIDIPNHIPVTYTLIIQNINADGYIYLGGSDVSSTNYGFRISPNQAFTIEMPASYFVYGIASAAGMTAAVMEIARAI